MFKLHLFYIMYNTFHVSVLKGVQTSSDTSFKGTVVNLALQYLHEVRLTVPLIPLCILYHK